MATSLLHSGNLSGLAGCAGDEMNAIEFFILLPDIIVNALAPKPTGRRIEVTTFRNGKQLVTGANIRTVDEHLRGTTVEGNRSRVASHLGGGKWIISDEAWDTSFDPETAERERRRKGLG